MRIEQRDKTLLIIIELNSSSDISRIGRDVPGIIEVMRRLSLGKHEQVFRSDSGRLFGYLVKSSAPANLFRVEFEKCSSTVNSDTILVLEVGEEFAGYGFSRAWNWLQHHGANKGE